MSENPNSSTFDNPINASSFVVEVTGVQIASFTEAAGFENTTDVIEHVTQDAKGKRVYQKLPGNTKWGDLTLKRGFTSDDSLWEWRKTVLDGKIKDARKTITITGYDTEGTPKIQFVAQNAWISSWKGDGFSAKKNEASVEEIKITHEGLDRQKV